MASIQETHGRRYVRGVSIALGTMVLLIFTVMLITAAPGKEMLAAFGATEDPISVLSTVYDQENLKCALTEISCDILS